MGVYINRTQMRDGLSFTHMNISTIKCPENKTLFKNIGNATSSHKIILAQNKVENKVMEIQLKMENVKENCNKMRIGSVAYLQVGPEKKLWLQAHE